MAELQITCINKLPRTNTHEGITHVGGVTWKHTREEAIRYIESKIHSYYTLGSNGRSDVGVVNGANGKYLRTYANNQWNDNLLSLPECISQ